MTADIDIDAIGLTELSALVFVTLLAAIILLIICIMRW
jgi:hypothetical protein